MKISGIGNALVDIVAQIDSDKTLETLRLPKGSMTLIDIDTHNKILQTINQTTQTIATGGSAANTISGLALLGAKTSFVGKIAADETGDFFRKDQTDSSIESLLLLSDTLPTGKCVSLVTPCKERTMATYLGAASTLDPTEICLPDCDMIYIEGYLLYNHALIEKVMELAHAKGIKIALDLASYNVVEDNLEVIKRLVARYVDIIFANEEEAKVYTGAQAEEALEIIAAQCHTAIVKIGARGSLVAQGDKRERIGVIEATPRDKTGAGDLYAAGFIYGMTRNLPLKMCGDMGAVLSSKVVEVFGPKMDEQTWSEIRTLVSRIEKGENIVNIF